MKADCTIILIPGILSRVEIFLHCIHCSLSPPTHIVCSAENTHLLGSLEVILGNIQYSGKSLTEPEVDEAGWGKESSLTRWIIAFQCKITAGMPWTSQDWCYLINVRVSKGFFFLYKAESLQCFLWWKHTQKMKLETEGEGKRERRELWNCFFMTDSLCEVAGKYRNLLEKMFSSLCVRWEMTAEGHVLPFHV